MAKSKKQQPEVDQRVPYFQFIMIKDPHFRFGFDRPIGRSDKFEEHIRAKLKFVMEYAYKRGVKYLMIPGDVTDKKNPSDYSLIRVNTMIEEMQRLKHVFSDGILTIRGNHDIPQNYDPEQSIYNFLGRFGFITGLADGSMVSPVHGLRVWSVEFSRSGDTMQRLADLNGRMYESDYNVVMVHDYFAPLMKDNKFVQYLRYEDLVQFDRVDVFLFGHLHTGFPVKSYKTASRTQYYVNPWGFTRLVRDEPSKLEDHIPQLVHVRVHCEQSGGFITSIDQINLPCAPYSEAFVEEEYQMEKEFGSSISEFVNSMRGFDGDGDDMSSLVLRDDLRSRVDYYLSLADKGV